MSKKNKSRFKLLVLMAIVTVLFLSFVIVITKNRLVTNIALMSIILLIFMAVSYHHRLKSLKSKDRLASLVYFLSRVRHFLNNDSTIYYALTEANRLSSPMIQEDVKELIYEINLDKSVAPFIKFAHSFKSDLIEEIIIQLYQYENSSSQKNSFNNFFHLFSQFQSIETNERFEHLEQSYATVSFLPMLGGGLLILTLALGVMESIGEIINGF
ncbi:MAG TPA: hypothetical protein PKC96_06840 [Bacilli bacterium]|nr:hypothetical protein [Bacilli bacterium]